MKRFIHLLSVCVRPQNELSVVFLFVMERNGKGAEDDSSLMSCSYHFTLFILNSTFFSLICFSFVKSGESSEKKLENIKQGKILNNIISFGGKMSFL